MQINSKESEAYSVRGALLGRQGKLENAITDLEEAIRLNPKDSNAYRNIGAIYNLKEEYDNAEAEYTRAIEIDALDYRAYHGRGYSKCQLGKSQAAIDDYSEAVRLNPRHVEALHDRATVFSKIGDYKNATADLTKALEIDSKHVSSMSDLALMLASCPVQRYRDGAKAVVYAKKACELTAWKNPLHIDVLAASYAENGNFVEAVKLQKSIIEDPTYSQYLKSKPREVRSRLKLYEEMQPYRQKGKRDDSD